MNIRSMINVPLLMVAVVVATFGYILLGFAPIDNQISWTIAPIVLVVCYLALIPLAVITQKAKVEENRNSGG